MPECDVSKQLTIFFGQIKENTKSELQEWANEVVFDARRNLGATRDKISYRSTWKDGRPTSTKKKKFKGRIDATGRLRKSLKATVTDDLTVTFTSLDYGRYVDEGRKPGKWPNVGEIKTWIDKSKPVRLRDLETGQFVKKTERSLNTAAFLIGRKIKWFGIEETKFYSDAIQKGLEKI